MLQKLQASAWYSAQESALLGDHQHDSSSMLLYMGSSEIRSESQQAQALATVRQASLLCLTRPVATTGTFRATQGSRMQCDSRCHIAQVCVSTQAPPSVERCLRASRTLAPDRLPLYASGTGLRMDFNTIRQHAKGVSQEGAPPVKRGHHLRQAYDANITATNLQHLPLRAAHAAAATRMSTLLNAGLWTPHEPAALSCGHG